MFKLSQTPTQEEFDTARKQMGPIIFSAYCLQILDLLIKESEITLKENK